MIWDKKNNDKVPPLTSEQAKTLLKIGDRETTQYVVERTKSGTRKASIRETTLVVSANSQEELSKLLENNGISSKALRTAGFPNMDTTDTKDIAEIAIPLSAVEKIAGISWEAANPAVKHISQRSI